MSGWQGYLDLKYSLCRFSLYSNSFVFVFNKHAGSIISIHWFKIYKLADLRIFAKEFMQLRIFSASCVDI
jgi:hypothetical protein